MCCTKGHLEVISAVWSLIKDPDLSYSGNYIFLLSHCLRDHRNPSYRIWRWTNPPRVCTVEIKRHLCAPDISKRADIGYRLKNSAHTLRYLWALSLECMENNKKQVCYFPYYCIQHGSSLLIIHPESRSAHVFPYLCSDFTLSLSEVMYGRCSRKAAVPELETLSVLRVFVALAVVCCPMRQYPSLVTSGNTPERHTDTP